MVEQRLPSWLRVRAPRLQAVRQVEQMVRSAGLHTVCESARCPNLPECWGRRTATFMILGDVCTRSCGFCAIAVGRPAPPDPDEPNRVAAVAREMELRHVVVTSVARDDLPDDGAGQFAAVVDALHDAIPNCIVEVLTPDFKAAEWRVKIVTDARPEIYNHNVETVRRLQFVVRPQAGFERSLRTLAIAKELDPRIYTKSGLMLGLGETDAEIKETLRALRSVGVDAVTIGQYLRPTMNHLPVVDYVTPENFRRYEGMGQEMGFLFVASAPLVRSSYNAIDFSKKVMAERLAKAGA
jgi:lipoic acid synthetase